MLGRGKNPPGGLQLVDLPQALQPGVVEYFPLAGFALGSPAGRSERDIAVDRIVAEPFALKVLHGRYPTATSRGTIDGARETLDEAISLAFEPEARRSMKTVTTSPH